MEIKPLHEIPGEIFERFTKETRTIVPVLQAEAQKRGWKLTGLRPSMAGVFPGILLSRRKWNVLREFQIRLNSNFLNDWKFFFEVWKIENIGYWWWTKNRRWRKIKAINPGELTEWLPWIIEEAEKTLEHEWD